MPQEQILVVDDEPDIRELVKDILEDEGYPVQVAHDGEGARLIYAQQKPDLVLLDVWMPDVDGISLLKEWSAGGNLESQVVIMSGHGTLETAVEATRLGAYDFVQKPLSLAKLLATVRKALAAGPPTVNSSEVSQTKPAFKPVGNSPAMRALLTSARQTAMDTSPVLITGESGSGRATLAHYIHQLSPARGDMLVLDHAQASNTSPRSYLLGSEGLEQPDNGLLEKAAGGSLFIPEMQKLPTDMQELLNNILEAGVYSPEGNAEPRPLGCRFICSASENLKQLVETGQLLGTLYFRLNVLPLQVPPLRERSDDIPEMVRHFSEWFPNEENLPYRQFSVSIQNRLRNHSWPGNVRELRNLVKGLLVLGAENEVTMQELETALHASASNMDSGYHGREGLFDQPLRQAREQFERDYLIYQLKKAGGSVGKLADLVGMERTHLYRKLRSLGINPKSVYRKRGGT